MKMLLIRALSFLCLLTLLGATIMGAAAGTFPSDSTDQLVQANVVAAGYGSGCSA